MTILPQYFQWGFIITWVDPFPKVQLRQVTNQLYQQRKYLIKIMLLRSSNLSPIIFVYKSLYNLMKKGNKESKFQSAIHSEDQQFQQQIQQQQNPLFGEVDGQIIKLGGLDYSLLEQEKSKAAKEKRNILDGLINKINIIEGNVLQRTSDPSKQKQQKKIGTDQYYKDLVKVFNELRHGKHMQSQKKRTQTYLVFELDEFGRRIPTTVQKRIGKVTNKPIYTHFDEKFNKQFGRLLKVKQNHIDANKIIGQARQMYAEDDEDDMFGDDSPNQEKGQSKMNEGPSINIEIGKKLSFGLQQDIFASVKRQKPIPVDDTQPQQNDKYFFMRKKVKVNAELEDGYGECYHQSGPSLQELVDLKKQGIEFYGDLKQFKPKQRKAPNINKEYAMVQKIIERNNKK